MISSLALLNFQPYSSITVELDKHLTVIVGPTDSGKSSLLRALQWLATNYPSGDAFIKHGEESTTVTLKFDSHRVKRKKGKRVNTYSLDGKRKKAFGKGKVPDVISSLLNLGDVNFQGQLDPPFWFLLSPGQVSRELNAVVHLDQMDRVMAHLASELRKVRVEEDLCKQRLGNARQQRDDLAWVKEADQEYTELETLQSYLEESREDCVRLSSLVADVERLSAVVERSSAAKADAKKLRGELTEAREQQKDVETLERLYREGEELCKTVKETKEKVALLRKSLKEKTQGRCPVCGGELRIP